jgi:uncharacterized membrane protein
VKTQHPGILAHEEEWASSLQNRVADVITSFSGSMIFAYLHIAIFAFWLVVHPFGDNFPFGLLTMIVSLEAIFLSTFVMISQNRADKKRQSIADAEWLLVQTEDRENKDILDISRQILALTQQTADLSAAVHALLSGQKHTG